MSAVHGSNQYNNLSANEILEKIKNSDQRTTEKIESHKANIAVNEKLFRVCSDDCNSKLNNITQRMEKIRKNNVVRNAAIRGAAVGGLSGSLLSGFVFGPVGAVIGLFVFAIISAFVCAYITNRK